MKKGTAVLLILMLVFLCFTGCSSNNKPVASSEPTQTASPTEPSSSDESAEPVHLKMTFWGNETYQAMYEKIIDLYQTQYPNVEVEPILIPYSEYNNKITVMLTSGAPPDVGWLASDFVTEYIANDALVDLSKEVIDDPDFDFDDIYASTTWHLRDGDALYGVPTNAAPKVIFVNKDLLNAAGLADPNTLGKEWTNEKRLEYAKAMTDPAKGIYGMNIIADWKNWYGGLLNLIWAYGGNVMSDDNKEFVFDSPETAEALQFFCDSMFKYKVHPMPGAQVSFDSGQIGLWEDNYSYAGKLPDVSFDWDIAPLPYGKNDEPIWVGSSCMAAFKEGEHHEEAINLVKAITGKEGEEILMTLIPPSRKSLQESDSFLTKKNPPSQEGIRSALIDRLSGPGKCFITPPNWSQINAAIQSNLDELFGQTADVQTVLDKIDEEVKPLLNN
jgi:multiple sugar transport system substrate-binding protein